MTTLSTARAKLQQIAEAEQAALAARNEQIAKNLDLIVTRADSLRDFQSQIAEMQSNVFRTLRQIAAMEAADKELNLEETEMLLKSLGSINRYYSATRESLKREHEKVAAFVKTVTVMPGPCSCRHCRAAAAVAAAV